MHGVVICGAGPVGLLLACELRLAGVDVVVLERLAATSDLIKAGSVGAQTALSFDQRGLLAPLLEAQAPELKAMRGQGPVSPTGMLTKGHFAGLWLVDHGATSLGHGGIVLPQADVERVLERRALELGAVIRRGVEVIGVSQSAGEAVVELAGERLMAQWVVGCDGGRSRVRKSMQVTFDGTDATLTGRQALVEMQGAEALPKGWQRLAGGMMVNGPFNRVLTVEFDGPPTDRTTPLAAEEIEASVRRVSGVQVTVTKLISGTRWTDNARVASSYRDGRLFVAGDAAHIHSPFGGQGLNLGFQDAMNLGWKLAAVMRGAGTGLLDTYTLERKPAAERVLDNTRAQTALMRPGAQVTALRAVFSELVSEPATNARLAAQLTGRDVRYSVGSPLAGAMVDDRLLSDGTRLYEVLRRGRGAIVDLTTHGTVAAGEALPCVRAAPAPGEAARVLAVRPDGFVGWATDADDVRWPTVREGIAPWFA